MIDDPNLPPESEWPIKKGTPVWCVATGLAVHYPVVRKGRIDHYNAAVKGNGVTSQGKPYYKVVTGKSSHELVRVEHVFPGNKAGRRLAFLTVAEMLLANAEGHRQSAERAIACANDYLEQA